MKKNIIKTASVGIATIVIAGIIICVHHEVTKPSDVDISPTPPAIVQQVEENNDIIEVEKELTPDDFHCEFDYRVYKFKEVEAPNAEKLQGDDLILFYQQLADAGFPCEIVCDNEYLNGYKEFNDLRNKVNEDNVSEPTQENPTDTSQNSNNPEVMAYLQSHYTQEDLEALNWAISKNMTAMSLVEQRYAEWSMSDFETWLNGQIETFKVDKNNQDDRPFVSAEVTKESIKKHHGIN